jgi:sortase B
MRKIAYVLLPLFLAGVLFSVWKIISIERTLHSADDNYNYIAEIALGAQTARQNQSENRTGEKQDHDVPTSSTALDSHTEIDFAALREYNPDIIAWIRIPGTNIDYPVLQGPDNNKYLRHTPDGEYNIAGSIFMEFSNASDFSDEHSILYGHHFRGSYRPMFTQLVDYKSEDFYKSHPWAELFTPAGCFYIKICSCYVTKIGDKAWRTQLEGKAFSAWLEDIMSKALYPTEVIPTADDRIVTLSTCSTEFENARFVVHGILVPVENDT